MRIHLVFEVPNEHAEKMISNFEEQPGTRQMTADWLVHERPFEAYKEIDFINDQPVLEKITVRR